MTSCGMVVVGWEGAGGGVEGGGREGVILIKTWHHLWLRGYDLH